MDKVELLGRIFWLLVKRYGINDSTARGICLDFFKNKSDDELKLILKEIENHYG